ncbi:MAG: NAD(P)-dependent oxidoreductase [Persicimonas sp.]
MSKLPSGRLEEQFDDRKPLFSEHEAVAEANRCLYCVDAPCIPSCPTEIDIPEFIRKITTENVAGSAETIFESNILGMSCARVCPTEVLCESTCVYNEMDEKPIKIGRLQRYATEHAYREGLQFFEAGEPTGHRVGLIGAGPASLACAHELRRMGHATVLFEARERPGGLNTNGVAPYKMPANDSLREVDYVTQIGGIDIQYGVEVGRDISLTQLEADFDAVFIGVGLGPDRWLADKQEQLDGLWGAVDLIEKLKTEEGFALPEDTRRVAVIGGGNTALDVVREMRTLGVEDVMMVYRRDEAAMSGYAHEWAEAKKEGARGVWWAQPVEVFGDGKVEGLTCRRTRAVTDDDGQSRLEELGGTDFTIECDLVALAIGQSKLGKLFQRVEQLETQWGRIVVDPETGATGHPHYFAGGDCISGGQEVVNAVAEGKTAAHGIDAYLRK